MQGGARTMRHAPERSLMEFASIHSCALLGLQLIPVTVEVHLGLGLPGFTLVGLADTEVKEARERVRCAITHAGLPFPNNRRITVNLAPADLPKDSGRFDLPIALGILAASGVIDTQALNPYRWAGELSLSGEIRPVKGALAMALALQHTPPPVRLVLPPGSAEEAARVPGIAVFRAQDLTGVVGHFSTDHTGPGDDTSCGGWRRLEPPAPPAPSPHRLDLADVRGQSAARRALEIAAAGGHHLLLIGPPGTGKSMLAQRFAGLLPPAQPHEALESAAIWSLTGLVRAEPWDQRPTRSPPHTQSAPHGHRHRTGRRWLHPATGRDFAGASGGALSGRVAGVSPSRPRGLARTAGERGHHHFPGGATSRVSRAISVDRRHEPLSVWLPRRHPPHVSLLTGSGGALPGTAERPVARPHRPARGGGVAKRASRAQHPTRRILSHCAGAVHRRAPTRVGSAGMLQPGPDARATVPASDHPGRSRVSAAGGHTLGLVHPAVASHPARGAHHRGPGSGGHAGAHPHGRSLAIPRHPRGPPTSPRIIVPHAHA